MKLSIFCPFGLKTPTRGFKIGVLWEFHHQMGINITKTLKKHTRV